MYNHFTAVPVNIILTPTAMHLLEVNPYPTFYLLKESLELFCSLCSVLVLFQYSCLKFNGILVSLCEIYPTFRGFFMPWCFSSRFPLLIARYSLHIYQIDVYI